jgi:hypothetical protein
MTARTSSRKREIVAAWESGRTMAAVACQFHISPQRVKQIIAEDRARRGLPPVDGRGRPKGNPRSRDPWLAALTPEEKKLRRKMLACNLAADEIQRAIERDRAKVGAT